MFTPTAPLILGSNPDYCGGVQGKPQQPPQGPQLQIQLNMAGHQIQWPSNPEVQVQDDPSGHLLVLVKLMISNLTMHV